MAKYLKGGERMDPEQKTQLLVEDLVIISQSINDILRTSGRRLSKNKREDLEKLGQAINIFLEK